MLVDLTVVVEGMGSIVINNNRDSSSNSRSSSSSSNRSNSNSNSSATGSNPPRRNQTLEVNQKNKI